MDMGNKLKVKLAASNGNSLLSQRFLTGPQKTAVALPSGGVLRA